MSKKASRPLVSLVWAGASRLDPTGAARSLFLSDNSKKQQALAATACMSGLSLMSILAHQAPASANPTTALLPTGSAQPQAAGRTGVDLVIAIGGKVTMEEIRLLVPGASRLLLEGQEFALISSHQNSKQALARGRQLQFTLPWPLEILVYQKTVPAPTWNIVNKSTNTVATKPSLPSTASTRSAAPKASARPNAAPGSATQQPAPQAAQQPPLPATPLSPKAIAAAPAAMDPETPQQVQSRAGLSNTPAVADMPRAKQPQSSADAPDLVASASLASDIPQPLPISSQAAPAQKPGVSVRVSDPGSTGSGQSSKKASSKIVSPLASERSIQSTPQVSSAPSASSAGASDTIHQSQPAINPLASASSAANSLAALRTDLNYLLVDAGTADATSRLSAYTSVGTYVTISGVRYIQVGVYNSSRVGNYLLRQKMFQLAQAGFNPRTVAGVSLPGQIV
jgi:hypothetical protein